MEENEINEYKQKVIITINKDKANEPFVTAIYDFGKGMQSPFELDERTANRACYLARKSHIHAKDGRVLVNKKGEVRDNNNIEYLYDTDYLIAGSKPGKENSEVVIRDIVSGASNADVNIPCFITNGKKTVMINRWELLKNSEFDNTPSVKRKSEDEMRKEEFMYLDMI